MALSERLRSTFVDQQAVVTWMHTNCPYLGGLKPVEAIQVGRVDAIAAALEALDSGVYL